MTLRTLLAASAVLAFAAPAVAQDAPAPAPAVPPAAEAVDPAEAALEAKGEVFQARMQTMAGEMQTALTAAAGDQARANASLDAIVAQYQPEADAFATELEAFFEAKAASASEEERAQMVAMAPQLVATVKGVPAMVRGQVQQAVAAAPAAPAAPQ
jgi:hypothetical protein